jgi:hypothetical protein
MQLSVAMGLPLRIALPLFIGFGALFLAVMGYFVRIGLANSDAPLGIATPPRQGDTRLAATPAPLVTDAPGTFTVPQTGTGPIAGSNALPGNTVGGGGPAGASADSTAPNARTDAATALHGTGHDREALRELDGVLSEQPRFASALYERAVVLRSMGRRSDAIAAFRRFIDVAPNDPRADDARTFVHELGG